MCTFVLKFVSTKLSSFFFPPEYYNNSLMDHDIPFVFTFILLCFWHFTYYGVEKSTWLAVVIFSTVLLPIVSGSFERNPRILLLMIGKNKDLQRSQTCLAAPLQSFQLSTTQRHFFLQARQNSMLTMCGIETTYGQWQLENNKPKFLFVRTWLHKSTIQLDSFGQLTNAIKLSLKDPIVSVRPFYSILELKYMYILVYIKKNLNITKITIQKCLIELTWIINNIRVMLSFSRFSFKLNSNCSQCNFLTNKAQPIF